DILAVTVISQAVTANLGDVVVDNDIITLQYIGVEIDDPSMHFPQYSIKCDVGRNIDDKIDIHKLNPLIINGADSGIYDNGITQLVVSKGGDLYVFISIIQLEEKGIAVSDIKTVEVCFTVVKFGENPYKTPPLCECTVIFNVV
ncbi:MAG: hypothetical protein FWG21_03770, partial [Oscillospiraceae bacterium]|nr:hypothetical protein [Oscillospiraceae bacterium]